MQRRSFVGSTGALAFGAAILPAGRVLAQANAPRAGTDFLALSRPAPVDPPADKIEVVEFFGYYCPHCNAFEPVLAAWAYRILWAVLLMLAGTFLGAFSPLSSESTSREKAVKALGVLAAVISASLIFASVGGRFRQEISSPAALEEKEEFWIHSEEEGFQLAGTLGKPLVLDFYADWCAACHELDEKTWPDPRVRQALERFVPVKLDLTARREENELLRKKYRVIGMPTVIVMDAAGKELARFEAQRRRFLVYLD